MTKPWDKGGKTRKEQGYGHAWDKLRLVILKRDKHLCQYCLAKGYPVPGNEVDHIVPKSKGGSDDPANLQVLCSPCHRDKTIRDKGYRVRPRIGPDGWPI